MSNRDKLRARLRARLVAETGAELVYLMFEDRRAAAADAKASPPKAASPRTPEPRPLPRRLLLHFDECEHGGDSETYADDVRRAGARLRGRPWMEERDYETCSMRVEVDDVDDFLRRLEATDSGGFASWEWDHYDLEITNMPRTEWGEFDRLTRAIGGWAVDHRPSGPCRVRVRDPVAFERALRVLPLWKSVTVRRLD